MSPQIALLCCTAFVAVALVMDTRKTRNVSAAIWIPIIWTLILASRPVTTWLDPGALSNYVSASDGSPVDRYFLIVLMLFAVVVLVRRQVVWKEFVRDHAWLLAFVAFCGISIIWSDFPAVGLKRWIRAIGALLVILVVASEANRVAAVAAVIRRSAIVLLPFSLILIKYVRDIGIGYNYWNGEQIMIGVATDKNGLGRLCLVFGLFLVWELLARTGNERAATFTSNKLVTVLLILLAVWLLFASDSKTSLGCFAAGLVALVALGLPQISKRSRYLGTMVLAVAAIGFVLSQAIDLQSLILTSLNRDPTLTDRTFIWGDLLALGTNPILGVGYDTFWLGGRLDRFMQTHLVNQAHNGYLELYLEVGWVGLLLFAAFLAVTFRKAKLALETDHAYGRILAVMLCVFVLYNLTESGNKPSTLVSFVLLLVAIASPARQGRVVSEGPSDMAAKAPVGRVPAYGARRVSDSAPRARSRTT